MRIVATLFLALNFFVSLGQGMSPDNQKIVSDFIGWIKNQKIEELGKHVSYPLKREYPIADIENEKEFKNRYHEVFDTCLIKMIVNSQLTKDWSEMGWRGIMLLNGKLWLNFDGRLIGVNYQSDFETKKKIELINAEKRILHESMKEFEQPMYLLETARFRIRIDQVGKGNYRYASWPISGKMSEKPDLVINKGDLIFDGSGGNHRFQFKNGEYVYECSIIVLGNENSPPARLIIYKGDQKILSQIAKIIRNK